MNVCMQRLFHGPVLYVYLAGCLSIFMEALEVCSILKNFRSLHNPKSTLAIILINIYIYMSPRKDNSKGNRIILFNTNRVY